MELTVLGGGIAGISAAYHARKMGVKATVYEARERWGGLLDHFMVGDFRFDYAVHFAFADDPELLRILKQTEHFVHSPEAYNYERGRWLKHPVQNNLYPLPAGEKVAAIKSFIERPEQKEVSNYCDWLIQQYGQVIAERFPMTYTRKYWTVPAEQLSTDWIGCRLYRPSLDEVLFGAMTDETPNTYYIKEMLYPRKGGFRTFLEPLAGDLDIRTGKEAVRINPEKKFVEFAGGERAYYDHLASSLPLPELIPMIDGSPPPVKNAAAMLWATSVGLVSLGFNRPAVTPYLWFYVYDEGMLPSRVYSPSLKSPDNAPGNCSSIQLEIYFSRKAPLQKSEAEIIEHALSLVERWGFAARDEVVAADFRVLPYGNVVFDLGMLERRRVVTGYLKSIGILPIGRFGEWDYLWSNQCFASGKKVEVLLAGT